MTITAHRSGHSLGRAALPGRPVVGHGPGRNGPSTSCNARSWTSTLTQRLAAVQAKSPGDLLIPAAGRGWPGITAPRGLVGDIHPHPAGHAGWWVHTARALRDVLPETATALAEGPSPSTMSGRSAARTAPSVMR